VLFEIGYLRHRLLNFSSCAGGRLSLVIFYIVSNTDRIKRWELLFVSLTAWKATNVRR
jgi:hypothetical protein